MNSSNVVAGVMPGTEETCSSTVASTCGYNYDDAGTAAPVSTQHNDTRQGLLLLSLSYWNSQDTRGKDCRYLVLYI